MSRGCNRDVGLIIDPFINTVNDHLDKFDKDEGVDSESSKMSNGSKQAKSSKGSKSYTFEVQILVVGFCCLECWWSMLLKYCWCRGDDRANTAGPNSIAFTSLQRKGLDQKVEIN